MCTKKQDPTLWDKLLYIHKEDLLSSLLRYLKVNIFHVIFEMLITAYSMELVAILTKFYIKDAGEIKQLFIIMVTPTVIAVPLAALFSGVFVIYYTSRLYYYHHEKCENSKIELKSIIEQYRNEVARVQIFGFIMYITLSGFIPFYLIKKYPTLFIEDSNPVNHMIVIGGALGAIWNLTGYFKNRRILWNLLSTRFQDAESIKIIVRSNYNCFCGNVICNIISLIMIFILVSITFFSIHEKLDFKGFTTDYWFLIIYYFTIIALYIKHGFNMLYSYNNEKEAMFPPLHAILNTLESESN